MPFDPGLAARLEHVIETSFGHVGGLRETRMFGGFGYMLNGNMCLGIHKDMLIVRVGLEAAGEFIQEPHVRPMDLTGKVMKGWATIQPEAMEDDDALERYCGYAIRFVSTLRPKSKS